MEWFSVIVFIVCLGFVVSMFFSTVMLIMRLRKSKKLFACVDAVHTPEQFYPKTEEFIRNAKDAEFVTKAKVLLVYGDVLNERYEDLDAHIEAIDFKNLILNKRSRKKNNIALNEDSFYYFCFASCIKLYSRKRVDMIQKLAEKIAETDEFFVDQLFYALFRATLLFYNKEEDRGESFFTELSEGQHQGYRCAKSMADLYRNIAAVFAFKLASNHKDTEKADKLKMAVESWNGQTMGKKIIDDLGVTGLSSLE